MRALCTLSFFLLFALSASAKDIPVGIVKDRAGDTTKTQRGWVLRAGYNKQDVLGWGEIGIGRMNRLRHFDVFGKGVTSAAAAFTFGLDAGFGDSSMILAPKLAVEVSCILIGARVSYGYYMQDNNATGVIGIEGGFNIVSAVYLYAGWNFIKGNQQYPVIHDGLRISVGINYAFGMKNAAPPKSPTHL